MTDGTIWVESGKGSSISELIDATGMGATNRSEYKVRTDLLLTGHPLQKKDRKRIEDAVAQARRKASCQP